MSMTAIADASTGGFQYGSACSMVRKRICFVRCAAAANSDMGLAEMENFGKKKVLDHRVHVVPEPIRVLDLLEHLPVNLLRRLARVELDSCTGRTSSHLASV